MHILFFSFYGMESFINRVHFATDVLKSKEAKKLAFSLKSEINLLLCRKWRNKSYPSHSKKTSELTNAF